MSIKGKALAEEGTLTYVTPFDGVRVPATDYHPVWPDQEFNFAGPYGENGFLEDYTARVRGEQIGNVVLVTRNAAGQAQHIVANYRPRNTLLLLSRLIGEHFASSVLE
jgi:hypothetical protein